MIVLHFAKVSVLYPWVVISSLAKRLEKPPFFHSYTSFGVWLRDHYMLLQRFTIGRMPGLAKVVRGTRAPLPPCDPRRLTMPISHSSEQSTLTTTSLISKQAIPYQTRGDTYCPRVSTPKIRPLADSSMTNHKSWRSQPSPPFQTLLKPQHWTPPWSPHIMMDGRPTLSTSHTQHHKDGKACMTTEDCRAMQYY
jgi:hypothetical protein